MYYLRQNSCCVHTILGYYFLISIMFVSKPTFRVCEVYTLDWIRLITTWMIFKNISRPTGKRSSMKAYGSWAEFLCLVLTAHLQTDIN